MELRQLRYFAAVARVGSFLGAAEELAVAQPSLWRQVKALEVELGIRLFARSGRGVVITSAGLQLLPRVQAVLDQADQVRLLSGELARGRAGLVTIASAHPHIPRFLAPLVGGFHRIHPGVHVALHEVSGLPPVEQVLTGAVDFVTGLPRAEEALVGHRLGSVRLAVITSETHPWRHRAEISTSELRGVPVLTGGAESLTRRLLEPALREAGFDLDVALETGNATTLVAMAQAGLGVGVVADDNLAAYPASEWPALVDDYFPMETALYLYWADSMELAPAVRAFITHVTTGFSMQT